MTVLRVCYCVEGGGDEHVHLPGLVYRERGLARPVEVDDADRSEHLRDLCARKPHLYFCPRCHREVSSQGHSKGEKCAGSCAECSSVRRRRVRRAVRRFLDLAGAEGGERIGPDDDAAQPDAASGMEVARSGGTAGDATGAVIAGELAPAGPAAHVPPISVGDNRCRCPCHVADVEPFNLSCGECCRPYLTIEDDRPIDGFEVPLPKGGVYGLDTFRAPAPRAPEAREPRICAAGKVGCPGYRCYVEFGIYGCSACGGRAIQAPLKAREPPPSPASGAPTCATCQRPASCVGVYEDPVGAPRYACDDCCGHGNEDGRCSPLAASPASGSTELCDECGCEPGQGTIHRAFAEPHEVPCPKCSRGAASVQEGEERCECGHLRSDHSGPDSVGTCWHRDAEDRLSCPCERFVARPSHRGGGRDGE